MKYKVGDKVRIKSIDWFRNNGINMFVTFMVKYCGEVVTIKSDHKSFYRIKEDGGQYCWIDEMFECKMEEETKTELKFKVGDKVRIKSIDWYNENKDEYDYIVFGKHMFRPLMSKYCGEVCTIDHVHSDFYIMNNNDCKWTDEMIECKMEEETSIDLTVKGEDVKKRIEIAIPEGYEYLIESGKIIFTKKKKEYPKTFEECVSVLMREGGNRMSLEQMNTFRKLIDARNAYWTIYGKDNGLGKPWEPDFKNEYQKKYCIYNHGGDIKKDAFYFINTILAFPTPEMRDAFYENFKEEIEICKELL